VIAYLDCVGGIAGDMTCAALLDAGASEDALREVPVRLGLPNVELRVERTERHGIGALHLDVLDPHEGHHDRSWRVIRGQLTVADLEAGVRSRALAVFERLAEAESSVHGVALDDVHFHEIGAVDTLVDVVGAITLLGQLGVTRVVCSPLPMGGGTTRAAHGVLPLPAPATAALLTGAPVFGVSLQAELVTPTGAALAATLADDWGPLPAMTLSAVGYGAGTADFPERANLVRVLLGEDSGQTRGEVVLLETNLDDLLPELVPDAAEQCFAAGALDVWTAPVTMKKGRPGLVLSALARPAAEDAVARAMLEHTSALGVRVSRRARYELEREVMTVAVGGRPVRVKLGRLEGRIVNVSPEHDDCAELGRDTGTPVQSIWAAALAAAHEELSR
jgi:pyridinium-3,5-bisthiocarboxylic acid mononucleotide nickel chelatase